VKTEKWRALPIHMFRHFLLYDASLSHIAQRCVTDGQTDR